MTTGGGELTRELVEQRLARVFTNTDKEGLVPGGLRAAAVGIVLCQLGGELGFLLTMRSSRLARHASQYALPGGSVDAGETVAATVLRELEEELGLGLSTDSIIGRLPAYDTRSGFRLTPLVLWASDVGELTPSAAEVSAVFHIPVAALGARAVPKLIHDSGSNKPIIQVPLGDGRVIHAPTGAILYQFGQAVLAGRYVDARQFEEPRFAWR